MGMKKSIAAMKSAKHIREKETQEQSKFGNWWKTKAWPWLKAKVLSKIRLPSLRTILLLAILVYMANNGALKDMPNTQWLVECCVRLIECIFGAFRWLVEQIINVLDSEIVNAIDIIGLNELLSNFMKMIVGM